MWCELVVAGRAGNRGRRSSTTVGRSVVTVPRSKADSLLGVPGGIGRHEAQEADHPEADASDVMSRVHDRDPDLPGVLALRVQVEQCRRQEAGQEDCAEDHEDRPPEEAPVPRGHPEEQQGHPRAKGPDRQIRVHHDEYTPPKVLPS